MQGAVQKRQGEGTVSYTSESLADWVPTDGLLLAGLALSLDGLLGVIAVFIRLV